jgi:hypothetical protein
MFKAIIIIYLLMLTHIVSSDKLFKVRLDNNEASNVASVQISDNKNNNNNNNNSTDQSGLISLFEIINNL